MWKNIAFSVGRDVGRFWKLGGLAELSCEESVTCFEVGGASERPCPLSKFVPSRSRRQPRNGADEPLTAVWSSRHSDRQTVRLGQAVRPFFAWQSGHRCVCVGARRARDATEQPRATLPHGLWSPDRLSESES